MLEWLNEILKSATVTDGALEVEKLQKAIEAEFPKHAVPKQDYNDKVKELATANNTIKDLKKDNADNEELQTKVKNYETEIENLKNAATNTAREYALKDRLKEGSRCYRCRLCDLQAGRPGKVYL